MPRTKTPKSKQTKPSLQPSKVGSPITQEKHSSSDKKSVEGRDSSGDSIMLLIGCSDTHEILTIVIKANNPDTLKKMSEIVEIMAAEDESSTGFANVLYLLPDKTAERMSVNDFLTKLLDRSKIEFDDECSENKDDDDDKIVETTHHDCLWGTLRYHIRTQFPEGDILLEDKGNVIEIYCYCNSEPTENNAWLKKSLSGAKVDLIKYINFVN